MQSDAGRQQVQQQLVSEQQAQHAAQRWRLGREAASAEAARAWCGAAAASADTETTNGGGDSGSGSDEEDTAMDEGAELRSTGHPTSSLKHVLCPFRDATCPAAHVDRQQCSNAAARAVAVVTRVLVSYERACCSDCKASNYSRCPDYVFCSAKDSSSQLRGLAKFKSKVRILPEVRKPETSSKFALSPRGHRLHVCALFIWHQSSWIVAETGGVKAMQSERMRLAGFR